MKKFITLCLALIMVLSMVTQISAYNFKFGQDFLYDDTFVLGDINDDGAINAIDSLVIRQAIAGVSSVEINLSAADFDANNQCSAPDAYSLKLCIAGAMSTADFEEGKQVYKFTIAGNDISQYSIVLNEGVTDEDNSYFAYLNLQKYVEKLCGVSLPVSYGEPVTEKGIYLNQLDINTERGRELGIEGYKYEVTNGDLYVEGTYRGTMYAVYEILEDYLGVRFVSDYETFVYKARTVDIPEGTVKSYNPTLVFRHACQTYDNGSSRPLWHYFANKLNGTQLYAYNHKRFGTLSGPIYSNAHSFYEYWKMSSGTVPEDTTGMTEQQIIEAKFASGTAPDAYNWQPCATDETVYRKLFEGMLDCNKMSMYWGNELHYEEEISVMSFSILDNQNYCTCRNCTKIKKTDGYSGLYLQLYNKAVIEVQEYYPGIRLYGIVYAKDYPVTIKPEDNLVILYCGTGCNNHIIGMEECYEKGGQLNGMNNVNDEIALKFWGDLCKETGAELWFWIYPINYHYYLCDTPNIPNLYYDTKYLIEECNVNGIYYEGGGRDYTFEALKAYVTVQLMWDPSMTYDEYCDIIKEYLYINYGEGYEELFTYIGMMTEAGDNCGTCFINNYDRPGDMFSYEYLAENYDEMRGLLEIAYTKTKTDDQRENVENLLMTCDFMGLSSVHTDWYTNGNNVELYKERYDWMYNYIKDNDIEIFSSNLYLIPSTVNYDENPMIQFYEDGSRRFGIYP